jgi:hypothetical protein
MPRLEIGRSLLIAVIGGLLAAVYVGWVAYTIAERGVDRGLGVLVAWPALILLAAIALAPFVAAGIMIARRVRERRGHAEVAGDGSETITTTTFPS